MRPLMPPVQTPDNLFHDGNPLTGELGTIVDAEHLNNEQATIRDTQSELIAILTAAAMEPESTAGQVLAALNKLYAPLNDTLGALSSLVGGANKLPYFTAANAAALTALSSIGRDIIGKATVADVLTYLGLGEAAKRDVGTGNNQLPDMSSFASSLSGNGWQKLPGGLIIQWAQVLSNSGGFAPWTYPIAFPSACLQVYATPFVGASAQDFSLTMIGNPGKTAATTACYVSGVQSSTTGQIGVRYLAIGY